MIAYSSERGGDDGQIIASSVFMLFDEEGKFSSGANKLNLWPFYRVEERCACMQQYHAGCNCESYAQKASCPHKRKA